MALPTSPDTGAQEIPASKNPELEWIGRYFDGHVTHRFNGFGRSNDHTAYYDRQLHPESDRTRACVSVEWVAFSEIAQDANMVYVPCGISSGLRAHELLDQKNRSRLTAGVGDELAVSTYKAEEHLGASVHRDKVMDPNRTDNLRRARIIGRTQPDKMVIAPVAREGAVRELTRTGAFTRWQRYEEEDFMAFWYPIIDRCKGMVLDGDWNYSRNSIWEMMRGVLIQSGQIPSRPEADMDVRDLEGHLVTLQARAEKVAETLKYQLGKGFEAREAATALAQIFKIDEDIRAGAIPADKLHPVLKERSPGELEAMDRLKDEMKPVLLAHCTQYMRLDDLPAEYHEAAKTEPQKLPDELRDAYSRFAEGISARSLEILSVQPSRELMTKLAQTEPSPQRLFDSHERYFEKRAQAKMFEDDLYGKLSEWERVALPFAIGATETGLYPTARPMATMIFTDLKRGKEGFRRAQAAGAHDMNEIAGALGRDIAEVISANTQDAEALKARLKSENPGQIVVNTPSFLRIADAIEHFRKMGPEDGPMRFVAAPGASETSPQMRLALQMKYLDRNVERAVFQEGWEHSNDLVQLRVRARLIQAGLVERPAGAQSALRVVSAASPATPETLLDDIKLLTAEVKRAADANIRAPEQALALARLVTLHELLVDPTLQHSGGKSTRELVNALTADESLTCYSREEARAVTSEAKTVLLDKAALWMPRERLHVDLAADDDIDRAAAKVVQNRRMEDYVKAQDRLRGEQALAGQRSVQDDIKISSRGARR